MTIKTHIRSILLGALVTLSLAGFMIHARIHLIAQNPSFIVPFIAGILSVAVVPPCDTLRAGIGLKPR